MNKKRRDVLKYLALPLVSLSLLNASCNKNNKITDVEEEVILLALDEKQQNHQWYYFTDNGYNEIDLPQNAPSVLNKPWTEAVRISSIASVPSNSMGLNQAYAVVNRLGMLCLDGDNLSLAKDVSIFSSDSQESLVFSELNPIFYRYRSTFFRSEDETNSDSYGMRPFLVQYNPDSKLCFPLVSYQNLNIKDDEEVTDFFWNGKTWACSVKKTVGEQVEFSYFYWEPMVSIIDLSPALGKDKFLFTPSNEDEYKEINTPRFFYQAPYELKKLVSNIPSSYTLFVKWRDDSGTSPVSYYQQGTNDIPINGYAADFAQSGYTAAVFADGTTYFYVKQSDKTVAFRLPKLPAGFTYGEAAMSKDILYVSWEESNFYQTGRSGFIKVNINDVLALLN